MSVTKEGVNFSTKYSYRENSNSSFSHSESMTFEKESTRFKRLFLASTDLNDAKFFYRALVKKGNVPSHPNFSETQLKSGR